MFFTLSTSALWAQDFFSSDPYAVLDLKLDASPQQVQSAFERFSRENNPAEAVERRISQFADFKNLPSEEQAKIRARWREVYEANSETITAAKERIQNFNGDRNKY